MDRRSFSHQALHGWQFHDKPTYCRHDNMAYEGNLLISYSTIIGFYDKKHSFTILSPYFYSNTTAHHKSFYASASPYHVYYLDYPSGPDCRYHEYPKFEYDNKDCYSFNSKSVREIVVYNINKIKQFISDVKNDKYIDSHKNQIRKDREFYRNLLKEVDGFYCHLIDCCHFRKNKTIEKDIATLKETLAKRKTIVNTFWSLPESKQLEYIKKRIYNIYKKDEVEIPNFKSFVSKFVDQKNPCGLFDFFVENHPLSGNFNDCIRRLSCVKDKRLKHAEIDLCFFPKFNPNNDVIVSTKGFRVTTKTVKFLVKTFWRSQGRDITFKSIKIDNYNFDLNVSSAYVRIGCHIIPNFVIDKLKEEIEQTEKQTKIQ